MGLLFGTDGVRGIANTELSPDLAFKLGYYGVMVLGEKARQENQGKEGKEGNLKVLIGKDTRLSCDLLEHSITSGLLAAGADVYLADVLTTPAIAYLTKTNSFDLGIMISASHNSFEFNGIKFFDHQGFKLPDEVENSIEDLVLGKKSLNFIRPVGDKIGRSFPYKEGKMEYLRHLRYSCGLDLSGYKIALDCANGAAYEIAPAIYKELGADIVLLGAQPDGLNINHECGSTNLTSLQKAVLKNACNIGIAYDGDADRLQVVDHLGNVLNGDNILAILALYLKEKKRLADDTFVATVMSNLGLHKFAKENEFNLKTTAVGDRYVLEEMRTKGYLLGGEQSGHIILYQYTTTGDGILSSLLLLKALAYLKKTPYEARDYVVIFPQVLKATRVENTKKQEVLNHPSVLNKIDFYKEKLANQGRILVRASGTEPLIRVMVEGEDLSEIEKIANDIVEDINKLLM